MTFAELESRSWSMVGAFLVIHSIAALNYTRQTCRVTCRESPVLNLVGGLQGCNDVS